MIENTINATINMTTRDTKDGIADLIFELLIVNRKVFIVLFLLILLFYTSKLYLIKIHVLES